MTIKMIAMGGWGRGTYLADSWNRLDFFIVMSGALEYFLQVENLNLTAIRTIRGNASRISVAIESWNIENI